MGLLRAITVLCVLHSAGPVFAQSSPQRVRITLERTSCLGECPVYRLVIESDGRVVFEGFRHVRVVGHAEGRIDVEKVEQLLAEFRRIDYWSLEDAYPVARVRDGGGWVGGTDLPTTVTSITLPGRSKSVRNFSGAPQSLRRLETLIDEVVNVKRWVLFDVPTVSSLAADGWDFESDETIALALQLLQNNDLDVMQALLDHGLPPNARAPRLLFAARSAAMLKVLISHGADVNRTIQGNVVPGITPLMSAARLVGGEAVEVLLDAGARLRETDSEGQTALIHAAIGGKADAVRILLAGGADPAVRDKWNRTALDYAMNLAAEEPRNRENRQRLETAGFPQPVPEFELVVQLLKSAATR